MSTFSQNNGPFEQGNIMPLLKDLETRLLNRIAHIESELATGPHTDGYGEFPGYPNAPFKGPSYLDVVTASIINADYVNVLTKLYSTQQTQLLGTVNIGTEVPPFAVPAQWFASWVKNYFMAESYFNSDVQIAGSTDIQNLSLGHEMHFDKFWLAGSYCQVDNIPKSEVNPTDTVTYRFRTLGILDDLWPTGGDPDYYHDGKPAIFYIWTTTPPLIGIVALVTSNSILATYSIEHNGTPAGSNRIDKISLALYDTWINGERKCAFGIRPRIANTPADAAHPDGLISSQEIRVSMINATPGQPATGTFKNKVQGTDASGILVSNFYLDQLHLAGDLQVDGSIHVGVDLDVDGNTNITGTLAGGSFKSDDYMDAAGDNVLVTSGTELVLGNTTHDLKIETQSRPTVINNNTHQLAYLDDLVNSIIYQGGDYKFWAETQGLLPGWNGGATLFNVDLNTYTDQGAVSALPTTPVTNGIYELTAIDGTYEPGFYIWNGVQWLADTNAARVQTGDLALVANESYAHTPPGDGSTDTIPIWEFNGTTWTDTGYSIGPIPSDTKYAWQYHINYVDVEHNGLWHGVELVWHPYSASAPYISITTIPLEDYYTKEETNALATIQADWSCDDKVMPTNTALDNPAYIRNRPISGLSVLEGMEFTDPGLTSPDWIVNGGDFSNYGNYLGTFAYNVPFPSASVNDYVYVTGNPASPWLGRTYKQRWNGTAWVDATLLDDIVCNGNRTRVIMKQMSGARSDLPAAASDTASQFKFATDTNQLFIDPGDSPPNPSLFGGNLLIPTSQEMNYEFALDDANKGYLFDGSLVTGVLTLYQTRYNPVTGSTIKTAKQITTDNNLLIDVVPVSGQTAPDGSSDVTSLTTIKMSNSFLGVLNHEFAMDDPVQGWLFAPDSTGAPDTDNSTYVIVGQTRFNPRLNISGSSPPIRAYKKFLFDPGLKLTMTPGDSTKANPDVIQVGIVNSYFKNWVIGTVNQSTGSSGTTSIFSAVFNGTAIIPTDPSVVPVNSAFEFEADSDNGISLTATAISLPASGYKITLAASKGMAPKYDSVSTGWMAGDGTASTPSNGYLVVHNAAAVTTETVTLGTANYSVYANFGTPAAADNLLIPIAAGVAVTIANDSSSNITIDFIAAGV